MIESRKRSLNKIFDQCLTQKNFDIPLTFRELSGFAAISFCDYKIGSLSINALSLLKCHSNRMGRGMRGGGERGEGHRLSEVRSVEFRMMAAVHPRFLRLGGNFSLYGQPQIGMKLAAFSYHWK